MLTRLCRAAAVMSLFSLIACKEYKVSEIKDFRLYVNSDNAELKSAIIELTEQYNNDVGAQALTVVEDKDDSNSNINFVDHLTDSEGSKLGLGQWITTEKSKNNVGSYGAERQVTVIHSMSLEFDAENFAKKLQGMTDQSSDEYKHLYHLFCHEVGHGMQLDHSNDKSSVMYKSIPDHYSREIDFNGYFAYIRRYLNLDGSAH